MASSYHGKIARINMTTKTFTSEPLDIEMAKKYIGGRGLGTKMLLDEGCAKVEPLSPENKLIYLTGPLTGTATPTGTRFMVITKSPLTGVIASSNSGGVWGAKLKYAGWDGLIVEGKADEMTYIRIHDDEITFHSADEYVGLVSEEIDDKFKEEFPKCSVLNIGPAGEKLSLISCIMNDKDRAAGRSGVGAVMGSKNLKAIVVTATKSQVEVFDPAALKAISSECMKKLKENPHTGKNLKLYGTPVLVHSLNNAGSFPVKNFQGNYYDKAEDICGETLREKHFVKQMYCHRCPIGCGRILDIEGEHMEGPEYEALWGYGADCDITDLPQICRANHMCNEYGVDSISAPATIAAAMELYQRGYITDEDCDGVPLKWGNIEAITVWTKRMCLAETPVGALMAQGSYRLCEHYGRPDLSMSVKKQEMAAYDPRGFQGMGINYATSNRGACHVRGNTFGAEVQGDRTSPVGKAAMVKEAQDKSTLVDSVGLCLFIMRAVTPADLALMLNAATGTDHTAESVMEVSERIYNLERMFNKEAGMKGEEDTLPKRITHETTDYGPSKGLVNRLDIMLPEYYELRGWENGFPTEETIKKYKLEDVIK